jgi:hypothetical protein
MNEEAGFGSTGIAGAPGTPVDVIAHQVVFDYLT